jgi:hypothetical protein
MPTAHLAAYLKCGWFAHATLTSSSTIFKFTDKPQGIGVEGGIATIGDGASARTRA